jgi:hypothetical protein
LTDLIRKKNTDENVKKTVSVKLQENETSYAEMKKTFEQVRIDLAIEAKNRRIQEFIDGAKKIKYYDDYASCEYGEFNSLLVFIRQNKNLFTKEDEKSIIEIAHTILKITYSYIQTENKNIYGIRAWNIDDVTRQKLYIENQIKSFLKHYPNSGINFVDIILKCFPKTIIEFKEIEEFPFEKAYDIVKKYDEDNSTPNRGKVLVNYVVETQDKHQYNIEDLENFVLGYYIPQESDIQGTPLYTLYHMVNGVNKERIEDFLFNYDVDFAQKPNKFFDDVYGDNYNRDKARANLNEYAKNGLVYKEE